MNKRTITIFIIVVVAFVITKLFLLPLLFGTGTKVVSEVTEPPMQKGVLEVIGKWQPIARTLEGHLSRRDNYALKRRKTRSRLAKQAGVSQFLEPASCRRGRSTSQNPMCPG